MYEALISLLRTDPGVALLVSDRIRPGSLPQASQLPAVVVTVITGAPTYSDDGETVLRDHRVQIDCYGSTYTSTKQVMRAVDSVLSAFQGVVSGVGFASVSFENILKDTEQDLRERGTNFPDYVFRSRCDFIVWWKYA